MNSRFSLIAAILFAATHSAVASTRTWTGALNNDWYEPGNWSPAGVPAPSDTLNLTNANPTLSPPFTITGQIHWDSGSLAGGLTVALGGVVNLSGPGMKNIFGVLTNRGTVNWLGGTIQLFSAPPDPGFAGEIWNEAGGLIDIQCDDVLLTPWSSAALHNAGLLRKRASAGTNSLQMVVDNNGMVQAQTGELRFRRGGEVAGVFEAVAGAAIYFESGAFRVSGLADWRGPGEVCVNGGSVELNNASGTVTLCGGSIAGECRLTGTLEWYSGSLAGGGSSLTVLPGGVVNWVGPGQKDIAGVLTNRGTVNWLGGTIQLFSAPPDPGFAGEIWNEAGGLIDIQCDDDLLTPWSPAALHNAGLLRKRASAGETQLEATMDNSGTLATWTGTLNILTDTPTIVSGNIVVSLAGTNAGGDFGRIQFNRPLILNGTFTASTRDGFRPSIGDTFRILEYPSVAEDFTCLEGLDLGGGILLSPGYGRTSFSLVAEPYTGALQPDLFITRSPAGLRITWPLGFPGWKLVSTPTLPAAGWTEVPAQCGNQALVPPTLPQQYFRLSSP